MPRTAIVNITSRCNQRCVFCLEAGTGGARPREPSTREVICQLRNLYERGARQITFMGGETFFRKDFGGILDVAASLGYSRIGAATNGTALARKGFLREMASRGLSFVELSLNGHTPSLAGAISGTGFTFERQAAALAELDALGTVFTIVNVVVCRENKGHLRGIVSYVRDDFPGIPLRFKFKFVALQGRELARARATGRPLKYREVDAGALGDFMTSRGARFWYYNFPLCRLGRHAWAAQEVAAFAMDERYFDLDPAGRGDYVDSGSQLDGRVWPEGLCTPCRLRSICPGVEVPYFAMNPRLGGLAARRDDPARILAAAIRDGGGDPALAKRRLRDLKISPRPASVERRTVCGPGVARPASARSRANDPMVG